MVCLKRSLYLLLVVAGTDAVCRPRTKHVAHPSGNLVRYDPSLVVPETPAIGTRTPRSVVIMPRPAEVQSFTADLNSKLMSPVLIKQLESDYANQLHNYEYNSGYYIMTRDSRAGRPYGVSAESDAQMRAAMASATRSYMLFKGVPNFFASRPATRSIGESMNKTVATVKGATSVSIKSENGWKYDTGFNPFTMSLYGSARRGVWHFDASENIRDHVDPFCVASGRTFGKYSLDARFHYFTRTQEVSFNLPF